MRDFDHVTDWVFDLDNTLYPPSARLFDQIEQRMTGYVMRALGLERAEADALRRSYWARYGTTLAGLMREHGLDPEPYMLDVHDISFAALTPDPDLAAAISALPGRRFVYTNGSAPYAARVLEARGLSGLFSGIYGVEHAQYHPKPEASAYAQVFAQAGLEPANAAMFEDDPRNLEVPHALGLRTVLVGPAVLGAHIQHQTEDLTGFLRAVVAKA